MCCKRSLGEDGALAEDPSQQHAIQRILQLCREGLSLRAISLALSAEASSCRTKA
jgi:hypothetical protein